MPPRPPMQALPVPKGGIQPGTGAVALPRADRAPVQDVHLAGVSAVVESADSHLGAAEDTIDDIRAVVRGADGAADELSSPAHDSPGLERLPEPGEVQGLRANSEDGQDGSFIKVIQEPGDQARNAGARLREHARTKEFEQFLKWKEMKDRRNKTG